MCITFCEAVFDREAASHVRFALRFDCCRIAASPSPVTLAMLIQCGLDGVNLTP